MLGRNQMAGRNSSILTGHFPDLGCSIGFALMESGRMRLEGRPIGWFTSTIELTLEGNVLGLLRRGWFREGLQLELSGHIVRLEKPSWLKSHYVLKDDEGIELSSATLVGFFNARWVMDLQSGPGTLERAGWITNAYVLKQGSVVTAQVGQTKWWSREWFVVADDTLSAVDVLMVGLMYVTIRERESRQHSG